MLQFTCQLQFFFLISFIYDLLLAHLPTFSFAFRQCSTSCTHIQVVIQVFTRILHLLVYSESAHPNMTSIRPSRLFINEDRLWPRATPDTCMSFPATTSQVMNRSRRANPLEQPTAIFLPFQTAL
jgi:hypothetical protein